MLIQYKPPKFKSTSLAMISLCNQIIEEYQNEGYDLTLRQLYYQLVARDHIPNTEKSYKRIGELVSKARLAGLISWEAIVDRTRKLTAWQTYSSPAQAIYSAYNSYITDKWDTQPHRPEIWVEKEALSGVVARPADELEIPYFSCRGYISQSAMWEAAERLSQHIEAGQSPYIIHLGDHDPSGLDMTRDIFDRLELFLADRYGYYAGEDYEIHRLALNINQVREHNPPPNPAKMSDSRAGAYVSQYGRQSWELDALEPRLINQLVTDAVLTVRDEEAWDRAVEMEKSQRDYLYTIYQNARDNGRNQ